MFRKISKELLKWKESKYRKPLLLQGARQTGKTYSVMEFARMQYDNTAYVNFEFDKDASAIFAESLDPRAIIPKIEVFTRQTITKGRTLIFFDEIQLCPAALTSLKYFEEFASDYHVVTAGSLLGVAVGRGEFSFPVGKVNRLTLYPMDFEEYLIAAVGSFEFSERIKECFDNNTPMDSYYHSMLLEQYRKYLVVGGMPECVSKFLDTNDYIFVKTVQKLILEDYLDDMSKYNTKSEIQKTRLTYNSITAQLSKKNTKFQYKLVKRGGRASELENAVEWLVLSGIAIRVYGIDTVKKPLENYKNIDSFKIFMSDAGLLCAKNNVAHNDVLYNSAEILDFKGGMTENYVCCQLIGSGHICYTWQSGGEAEIDFVIQREGALIPIEVKSAENRKAKSLKIYMQRYKPGYAIKISADNFGFENGVKTIPLYAAFCI